MANHKSSIKRIRSNDAKRVTNRYQSKTMRNAVKDLRNDEVKTSASEKLPKVIAMVDKLAKKNVIHKNKAANLKSKLAKRVNALKSK
jgi:small subunit ribosomal protein S20